MALADETLNGAAELLQRSYLGNTLYSYAYSACAFLAIYAGLILARRLLVGKLRPWVARSGSDFDDFLVALLGGIRRAELAVLAFYLAVRSLTLGGTLSKVLHLVLVAVLSIRAGLMLQAILRYALARAARQLYNGDPHTSAALKNVQFVLNAVIWAGALLFILDNLGINITAAVAGLGIGGIAVAMAAQQILGDLFSSFVIYFDKPFKVGDFIIVGDLMGVVEHIGVKTTHVRSLWGELLVFGNSDLTSSRIRNFKQMLERRIQFSFGVVYQTPAEKVRSIPGVVREIFAAIDKTRLDRVHFKAFGASSLDFEVVYYVLSGDYNLYMDVQQRFNLELMERFQKEGIEFAYPTQTVFLAKG